MDHHRIWIFQTADHLVEQVGIKTDGGPPADEMLQGFVRQAYVEADTDTIRTIRRLAVEGAL